MVDLCIVDGKVFVKVLLPGECVWAEILAVKSDRMTGRIDNKTSADLSPEERKQISQEWFNSEDPLPTFHNYHFNDVLEWAECSEDGCLKPVDRVARQ